MNTDKPAPPGAALVRSCLENATEFNNGCPVQALGMNGGRYYFISSAGEVRHFLARELNEPGFADLFGGDLAWLQENFPLSFSGGRPKTGCEFNIPAARLHLIGMCRRRGLFDESLPIRSVGVWKHKHGAPLVHCGDEILKTGIWLPSGFQDGGYIYPATPAIARPAERPATTEECREILSAFQLWNFELAEGPEIALGLFGQALIAGALSWKAHSLFYGPQGSGKTTLARFMSAALGAAGRPPSNNFTEAGLRQDMTNQARAVLLDEMETDGMHGTMKPVIKMMRQMSSGKGANIRRGTVGGTAQSFRLNGCVMMFCILPPHMEPQDRARITRLKLLPIKTDEHTGGAYLAVENAIERASVLSAKLWRRAIDRLPHFLSAFSAFRASLTAEGANSRAADQLATILAGADILLFDSPPEDQDSRAERIDLIRPLIEEWSADEEENEGQQCLNRLYSSPLNVYSRDENKTIGSVIVAALDSKDGGWARGVLKQVGLQVRDYATKNPHLLISNTHEGLRRIYGGSKWEDGGWATALRYLPGTAFTKIPVRFAGVQSRATIIPAWLLPVKDEE